MFKAPLFKISPLINSYYLEQIGYKNTSFKINRSMKKSVKRLSKSIDSPIKWVFIQYAGKDHPVLLKKSVGYELILLGPKPLRLKKAKLEKDLEYWKKKLSDILKEDLGKSLSDILFPVDRELPEATRGLLIKAKAYPAGTIREWSGKKYKKLSSGKWMQVYEGSGSRGEKQAEKNVLRKIQNAKTMAEMAGIVRENKERFQDKDGLPLPTVKRFLEEANKSKAVIRAKEADVKLKDVNNKPEVKQYYDSIVSWVQAPLSKTKEMRNTAMLKDGSISGKPSDSDEIDSIDKHLSPIKEKYLYRGTTNDKWLKAKIGDEITTGIASFSKSEDVATEFTGNSKIVLRYTTPPTGKGIDIHSMINDLSMGLEWGSRGADLNSYKSEKEVIVRSKSLRVGKIEKRELSDGNEYTVIDVSVVQSAVAKSIKEESNNMDLSDDFNNKLSNRKKTEKRDISYWKKELTEIYNKSEDSVEKSLKDILFPGIESLPEHTAELLIKARGYSVGTIRKWSGKEYKKVSPTRWVRTYSETESRGAKQAVRNVKKKIANAKTMEELLEIVKENSSRFKDSDGKMLPIVKEFLIAVRGTEAGKKGKVEKKEMSFDGTFKMTEDEADNIVSQLKPHGNIKEYYHIEEDGDFTFFAEVDAGKNIENIAIDPYEELNKPEPLDIQTDLKKSIVSDDFRSYGSWNPEGKHLKPDQREKLNQKIAELVNKDFHTEDEKETIRLYSGFGGTHIEDEQGVLYDYYTSPPVAKMVYQAINKISEIKPGDKILEPACGTGVFFDVAPDGIKTIGVEYDSRTSKAASILQPMSDIQTGSFEQFNLHSDRDFDVVIGNCPFGKRSVETSFIDSDVDANGKSIPGEDTLDRYFISKSLDNLKPEGTMGMIAYSGIMNNKTNTEWRKQMLRKGQFVGAMQLPNESFKHTQTGVSPDIYFFKKHSKEVQDKLRTATEEQLKECGAWNEEWVNGGYYDKNPENRLGNQAVGNFGADITVGKVTDGLLNDAVKNFKPVINEIDVSSLPSPAIEKPKNEIKVTKEEASAIQAKTLEIGRVKVVNGITYFLNGNHRWERVSGQEDVTKRIPVLTKISLKINEIRKAMQNDVNPSNLQNEVRDLLDEYKKEYGSHPGGDKSVLKLLKTNPALKSIHEAVNVTLDSGILNNQNIYAKEIKIVDGHKPEIVALKEIQKNLATASPEIIRNMYPNDAEGLMKSMLDNPDIFIDHEGNYKLREDFIAGDAWTKIDNLRSAMDGSDNKEKLQYGIDELEKAIGWVSIEDADVMPQSSWIPEEIIEQWAREEYKSEVRLGNDGKWYLSYGWNKDVMYYLNFQKQRGGASEENEANTMSFNQSADDSFKNFIATHEDLRLQMEEMYNRKFNTELGVPNKTYTVEIEGWDKYILDPWQWQTIHHLYEKGKGISALGTGFGKTLSGVALMALLRQEGKIKRPLYQVPNNKVKDWLRIINASMPGLKVGYVDPEEKGYSNRDTRYQMYQDLANNEYDVLILPESSASEIQLSGEEDAAITNDVILSQMPDLKTEKQRAKAKETMKGKMVSGKKNQTITFEDLGVDALFVDEAHNYKNLFSSSLSRETGLNDGRRSERALSFYKKSEYIRKKNDGKNVFLLTATPLTNSPLEYYNMLSHVAPEEFKKLGIKNINDFITNFADIKQSDEYDWASDKMVNKKVLKGFKNLRSLQDMFFKYTDLQNDPTKIGLAKPESTKKPNILEQDPDQVAEMKDLSEQLARYKAKSKEEREDNENTLTYFSKMRSASLDLELYDPAKYAGWNNPKIDKMSNNAYDNWKATDGGQIIFCDRVLSSDKSFNLHEKIKADLVKKGFKESEIAIVNGITKSGASQGDKALQTKVSGVQDGFNSGKYKVLIGTTSTIGEGLNLQKNSAALHHLDIPYRPSDFIQRNGRIDRQGNKQKSVELHTYASAGTTDNYSIAKVSGKENWINTLLKTKSSVFTNPDGEGFDMDEMMISLQGEWGQDTTKLKEKIKEQKEAKVKKRNTLAMNATMKKLSMLRGSLESYNGEKGSKQYQNMINKEAVYVESLKGNPEFHNHELTDGERTPFMYDSNSKKVIKIGDYYSKAGKLYKVKNIDFKKGEVGFYDINNPAASGYEVPKWTIKAGFGGSAGYYVEIPKPQPRIQTAEDEKDYITATKGDFFSLNDQKKKELYPDYISMGEYNRPKDALYLADNKTVIFSNNDGVLLNPYVKEDLSKIRSYVDNFVKTFDYEDKSTENQNMLYNLSEALKDPSMPREFNEKINKKKIDIIKKEKPELVEKLKDSKEWSPIPEGASRYTTDIRTLGYEVEFMKDPNGGGHGYFYRRP